MNVRHEVPEDAAQLPDRIDALDFAQWRRIRVTVNGSIVPHAYLADRAAGWVESYHYGTSDAQLVLLYGIPAAAIERSPAAASHVSDSRAPFLRLSGLVEFHIVPAR